MSDFPVIHAAGENRVLSLRPRTMAIGDKRCCHGVVGGVDGPSLIPRNQWAPAIDLSGACERIMDQNGRSLCWAFMGIQTTQMAFHLSGKRGLKLSPGSLVFKVNGGVDDGAGIDQAAEGLLKYGAADDSLIPDLDYRGRDFPAGWEKNASLHTAAKLWDVGYQSAFDGLCSGLNRGWVGGLGTMIFGGGHAVTICGYFIDSGTVYPFGVNSWSANWTNWTSSLLAKLKKVLVLPEGVESNILKTDGAGYWVFPENKLKQGLDSFGGYCYEAPNPEGMMAEEVA